MELKARIFHIIPKPIINNLLLTVPLLYRTRLVNYETNLSDEHGIEELLDALNKTSDIKGDIIECGSARCGATVIMANYLLSQKSDKKIYACDTFGGFDTSELEEEQKAGLTNEPKNAFKNASYEYVKKKIKKLGLSNIFLVKGLFENTLPKLNNVFSLALIDCDLRKSIIHSAEIIWPNLSSGGIMLFDDYTSTKFKGAKLGIDFVVKKFTDEIQESRLLNRLYYICKK